MRYLIQRRSKVRREWKSVGLPFRSAERAEQVMHECREHSDAHSPGLQVEWRLYELRV